MIPHDAWRKHVRSEIADWKREGGFFEKKSQAYLRAIEDYLVTDYYCHTVPETFRGILNVLTTQELAYLESHGQFGTPVEPAKVQYLPNWKASFWQTEVYKGWKSFEDHPVGVH